MEQVERDKKLAELVAHMTPQEMAERILAVEEQRDVLQSENDRYLFGGSEQRALMHQEAGTPNPEPELQEPPLPPEDDDYPDDDIDEDEDVEA